MNCATSQQIARLLTKGLNNKGDGGTNHLYCEKEAYLLSGDIALTG
jgi:hypothetical protein